MLPTLLGLLARSVSVALSAAERCTTCVGGESIAFPDKAIKIDGLPIGDCATLEGVAWAQDLNTPLCDSIQSVGSLCGCPVAEDACTLCADGSSVVYPDFELLEYPASDYLIGTPDGAFLSCEVLEALLHSKSEDSKFCVGSQYEVYARCGCPEPAPKEDDVFEWQDDAALDVLGEKLEFCTVCVDSEPMGMPDKPLSLGEGVPISTCKDLEGFALFCLLDSQDMPGYSSNINVLRGKNYRSLKCDVESFLFYLLNSHFPS